MRILAIDPGPKTSGAVLYNPKSRIVVTAHGEIPNRKLRAWLRRERSPEPKLLIEKVVCYGRAVGAPVLETAFWSGRFVEAVSRQDWARLSRPEVCSAICRYPRAKKGEVNQAVIDRFGGDRKIAVGKKANPGPLYLVKKHAWDALALAIAWIELEEQNR